MKSHYELACTVAAATENREDPAGAVIWMKYRRIALEYGKAMHKTEREVIAHINKIGGAGYADANRKQTKNQATAHVAEDRKEAKP